MSKVGSSASRGVLFFLGICITLVGAACQESLPTSPSSTTELQSPIAAPPSSKSPAVELAGFTCDDLEEVRMRFSDPGFVRHDEVAVYVAFLGAPAGDKYLRIYWDYDNERESFQIVDTQAGSVRRDNDALFDIEAVVEHAYEDFSGAAKRTVRVELIHEEGNTRLCGRNREISIQPPPRQGAVTCESHPQWQPVDCTTPHWVWSSDRGFTTLNAASRSRRLWVGDQHGTMVPDTCSLDGTGWVSKATFVMNDCDTDWYHIGGSFTGDCRGHDGDVVRRLALAPSDCFDY